MPQPTRSPVLYHGDGRHAPGQRPGTVHLSSLPRCGVRTQVRMEWPLPPGKTGHCTLASILRCGVRTQGGNGPPRVHLCLYSAAGSGRKCAAVALPLPGAIAPGHRPGPAHLCLYSDTTSGRKCYRSGWHRPPRYTCVCTPMPHQDANVLLWAGNDLQRYNCRPYPANGSGHKCRRSGLATPHGVICRPAGSGSIREFPRTTRLRVRVT